MDTTPRHKRKLQLYITSMPLSIAVVVESAGYSDMHLLHVFVAGELATLWYHNQSKKCMQESIAVSLENEDRTAVPSKC